MNVQNGIITLEKELNELDLFVLDFVNCLHEHPYVIVSGYVSILFGRSRSSEDVDMIIAPMNQTEFFSFFENLQHSGFECIIGSKEEAHSTIKDQIAVRFARNGTVIPNMEVKFAKKFLDFITLQQKSKVILNKQEIWISPIELQITYKRKCLGSEKDLEDAKHLEVVFEKHISSEKLKNYEDLIKEHGC